MELDRAQSYVDSKFNETQDYIRAEIEVLNKVRHYEAGSNLLGQLEGRIMMVVKANMPSSDPTGNILKDAYLAKVSRDLQSLSMGYRGEDGSFWEDLGDTLKGLGQKVLSI